MEMAYRERWQAEIVKLAKNLIRVWLKRGVQVGKGRLHNE
jgi:hypothetical protein